MVNGIRTIFTQGLNKGFGSKFEAASRVWQEIPEKGWRMHRPKRYEYNNKDVDNRPTTLNDMKY